MLVYRYDDNAAITVIADGFLRGLRASDPPAQVESVCGCGVWMVNAVAVIVGLSYNHNLLP